MTVNSTDLQTRISSNTVQGFGQQINAFKANLGGYLGHGERGFPQQLACLFDFEVDP